MRVKGVKICETLKKSLTFHKTFCKKNHAHPFYLRKWVTLSKPMLMQSSWDKPTPNAKGFFSKYFKDKVLIKNKIKDSYIIDTKFNNWLELIFKYEVFVCELLKNIHLVHLQNLTLCFFMVLVLISNLAKF
jgi:hypothetical protein